MLLTEQKLNQSDVLLSFLPWLQYESLVLHIENHYLHVKIIPLYK